VTLSSVRKAEIGTPNSLRESAHSDSRISLNYLVLTVASCIIATLGLIENSVAVIIGAMVVAPLIGPIQSFAYGALDGHATIVRRSLVTTGAGTVIAIGTSGLLAAMIPLTTYGTEVVARTRPNLLDLGIAVAAGGVAGFAKVRTSIANAVAGTAIAVALMPPLCVVGLTLARGDYSWALGAMLLFGTNFLGIALSCMVVYVAAGQFRAHNRVALVTTAVITAAIAVPLGASLIEIVRESQIEADIRHELTTNTVTFKEARLVGASFEWYTHPTSVDLDVSSSSLISSTQVRDLETFVQRRTGHRVRLVMHLSQYVLVTDTSSSPDSRSHRLPGVPTDFNAPTPTNSTK
jgi:uncharacterized hydrophobic protein (TIGR00271 family)